MRGVCFCEKAHFSFLYTPVSFFAIVPHSVSGIITLQETNTPSC